MIVKRYDEREKGWGLGQIVETEAGEYVLASDYDALAARLEEALLFLERHWSSCTINSREAIEALRNGTEYQHDPDCPFCRAADSATPPSGP